MTHSLRASYAVFQLLYRMRWKAAAWLTRGYWRRTRGLHSQSFFFYQQYLLPVFLQHVVVGFKGRLRAEPLLLTDGEGASVKSLEDNASSGRSVALGAMDGSSADSHQVGVGGQVRSAEDTGSVADSQLLYHTLVRDGAIPAGFLFEFESLMTGNEDDAARQSRQNFRDDVQSAIWLHEKSKEQNRGRREEKTATDLFVQAASLKPRRFKNRLARTLAAGPNSRRDAEELERSRWVHNLTVLLTGTDTPSGRLLASRQSSGQFLGAGLRASTLRGKVRNFRKFMAWLATTHEEVFPTSYLQYIQYLQVRQSEPSNRGALKDCHASFQFLEEVAGLPAEQKQTSTELYTLMYKEVLSQATPGRPVRQSPRMFVKLLAEIESLVIDPSKQTYLRIFGWWVLLQSWGTVRFSDHRGLVPKQITVDDTGFTGVLSRSKTLGTDKTVGSRPVFSLLCSSRLEDPVGSSKL